MKEYIIENEFLKVTFLDVGCCIKSIIYKPLNQECVVGYLDNDSYLDNAAHIGASITGPFAGRINNGTFNLNNKTIKLDRNFQNKHHIHGGFFPLVKEVFDVKIDNEQIIFSTVINNINTDNVDLYITNKFYLIDNKFVQEIKASIKTDKEVLFNPTNHTYFNFNPSSNIMDYNLDFTAKYAWNLNQSFMLEKRIDFKDSIFANLKDNKIKSISMNDSMFDHTLYIDHPFELESPLIKLKNDKMQLEINTTSSALVVYTANFLDTVKYEMNVNNDKFMAVCLETQELPNAINNDSIKERVIVRKNKPIYKKDIYTFAKI